MSSEYLEKKENIYEEIERLDRFAECPKCKGLGLIPDNIEEGGEITCDACGGCGKDLTKMLVLEYEFTFRKDVIKGINKTYKIVFDPQHEYKRYMFTRQAAIEIVNTKYIFVNPAVTHIN